MVIRPEDVPDALVEKAKRAFAGEVKATWNGVGEWSITVSEDAMRHALAAALDVEEMARELFVADSWQDREFVLRIWFQAPDDQAVKQHWRRIATALRTALLGLDVAARLTTTTEEPMT